MLDMAMTEQAYKEIIEQASTFNTKLLCDRKYRLPFLDTQTGVAQTNCHLFVQRRQRASARKHGQLISYPANRWKKKNKSTLWDLKMLKPVQDNGVSDSDIHSIKAVENVAVERVEEIESNGPTTLNQNPAREIPSRESLQHPVTHPRESWYDIYDDELDDLPDAGEIDDQDSDGSEYDGDYGRRKRKKKVQKGGRKRNSRVQEIDRDEEPSKPYSCERGGGRRLPATPTTTPNTTGPPGVKPKAQASPYCDFCMGDNTENKKTGKSEELVSCGDCGRSGHPSCLMFTDNMIVSVKKYRWQCIECKSCGLCGTSDNDDQLLFCDDCDRGYHMYCLNPPLQEPPEGNWSCHLCIAEFGDKASIRQQDRTTSTQQSAAPTQHNGGEPRGNGLEQPLPAMMMSSTPSVVHHPPPPPPPPNPVGHPGHGAVHLGAVPPPAPHIVTPPTTLGAPQVVTNGSAN